MKLRMKKRILYLGDTHLQGSASYLAGIMEWAGLDFDYANSETPFSQCALHSDHAIAVISDYPSRNFSDDEVKTVCDRVNAGMSLLMIGGWDTFTGVGGKYNETALRDVLPVEMSDEDDRVNSSTPCYILPMASHEIIDDLPFAMNPTYVGGFNKLVAKADAETILKTQQTIVEYDDSVINTIKSDAHPLLVLGKYGKGKTAAFASDVAPHWVGGFVDWGDERVVACGKGAETIDVGSWYAAFFANLLKYLL